MYLVSACLLGLKTRFDGHKLSPPCGTMAVPLEKLVPVCPEQLGGLPTPRFPAEIQGGQGEDVLKGTALVLNTAGDNVTEFFLQGAREILSLANLYQVEGAFLKDGSPSCGSCYTYDGTFSGRRCPGTGVTAALLRENGIPLFNEKQLFPCYPGF
ncbi:MAG: DUF523 domain-containing protein [Dethiobacter sp.]|jgi:uncharacterized protein YbbK (DUF523 family)|nr:MAG: DUF523 domain-containing protein [Dethiobacter sp.]